MFPITIKRTQHRLNPNPRRVLAKPYLPGEEILLSGPSRAQQLMDRIMAIPESEVVAHTAEVMLRFEHRHHDFTQTLRRHFALMKAYVADEGSLSDSRKLLIGAYFTHEYAVEAA